jgi:hypothetical protein
VGRFFNAVKHGFQAMGEAPEGEPLHSCRQVRRMFALLARPIRRGAGTAQHGGLTFFNLDWANRSAATLDVHGVRSYRVVSDRS